MKKFIKIPVERALLFLITVGMVTLSSCGGDDDEGSKKPVAAFDYEVDGKEVTFTNNSTNATSYVWDFGDGETSTEESPVHTYDEFGVYNLKLTATGNGGTATSLPDELTLAKSSNVVIDGTFTDWDDIEAAATSVDGDGASLSVLKADYDAEKVYIYVKGDIHQMIRVFLNSDNVATTGATAPAFDYLWKDLGADYFMETDFVGGAQLFADDPAVEDWGWTETIAWANGATFMNYSAIVGTGDSKQVEFSFKRASIPGISPSAIRFGVIDINTTTWANDGGLPARTYDAGETKVYGETFLLDLTQ